MKDLKLYIIAGEASGDLHGANLMKALKKENSGINFQFFGGDRMKEVASAGMAKHISELAFMGFWEVVMNIRTIFKNISFCKSDIEKFSPDALVLVDYPGFNLRIAKWANKKGIKVIYYISPQVWAWKQSRVYKIKKIVDEMYVILPFEQEFYAKFNIDVEYVGHPLLDEILHFNFKSKGDFLESNGLSDKPIIAVLPGSRKQEIEKKLPIMLQAMSSFKEYQIIVAGAPSIQSEYYTSISKDAHIVYGETYNLLANAECAVVTSGTATLEAALIKVPEVVCYKGSWLSYIIAKKLIKVKFISLVNLILDRQVVKELIQNDCTSENIEAELELLLNNARHREEQIRTFEQLSEILGGGGASKKVAQSLLKTIQ